MTRIVRGSAAVTIRPNGDGFYALLTVNGGETVLRGQSLATEAAARRWADRVLAKHEAGR